MTEQTSRYDRIAEGYAAWWSPVHRPATLDLLDEVAAEAGAGHRRILDVGCGTGAFAVAAVHRWPEAEVDATDASTGMLEIAAREVDASGDGARIRLSCAPADRLPFDDRTFDVAVAAFVLQLVPSRPRALREMRRVLRPGGRLALVAWLQGETRLAADDAWDAALGAVGIDARGAWGGHDDVASPSAAVAQLRHAGLSGVRAREDRLVHQFAPEGYLAFLTRFDDGDLVAGLDPATREALEADALARLRRLPPEGLCLSVPIVYASGVRR